MRSNRFMVTLILAGFLVLTALSVVQAKDYESRFIKHYPPGYYGMWYNAQRFSYVDDPDDRSKETYRWDRYMSRATHVRFPFLPVPYGWEYGTRRTFNLPNYNTNDWP